MLFNVPPFEDGVFQWRHALVMVGLLSALILLVGAVCIVARNLKERREERIASQRDLPTIIEVESNPAFEEVKK
ncbi:hypothetical protein PRIPAC_81119 [Pristionchus pacificus]|uniref:Uncharacterized protein n=1 Tax=Pristionchus pacificus TaxID=54126 RepID=A0A454XXQ3_PRIPA|nr:hypothetical protein PRIPAC_81119 [Pristionchus pacificus]|eukprot:PDM78233.1 hypothetical protein PRIPAC_30812 [Pristionchus pacificus]